jgi:hypothetical protein
MSDEPTPPSTGASRALRDRFLNALDADECGASALVRRSSKLHRHRAALGMRITWSTTGQYVRDSRIEHRRVITRDRGVRITMLGVFSSRMARSFIFLPVRKKKPRSCDRGL